MNKGRLSRRELLGLGAGAAFLAACGSDEPPADPAAPTATAEPPPPSPTVEPSPTAGPSASLEEMVAQMVMVGFDTSAGAVAQIRAGSMGNAVLFGRNVQSPGQLAGLTRELQSAAGHTMLIAADQEGGSVARLSPAQGFPQTATPQYLGSLDDEATSRRFAQSMAKAMADAGVNLNLAPVVDVNVNPASPAIGAEGRSFSADPEVVARQARIFIEEHRARGVLCTLKHFPGHGSSTADSHLDFTDVTRTWTRRELVPYQRLIAGDLVDAVMAAHVFNETLDAQYPASLSRATIQGLLRDELGYQGVVISDDMQMGAISKFYGFDLALELALNAGTDVIAIADPTVGGVASGTTASASILKSVREGRVSEGRIEEAFGRISKLKAQL